MLQRRRWRVKIGTRAADGLVVEPLPTAVPGNVYSEKMHRLFWVVVTMAASAAVVSRAQGTKSIWSGIYTEAQATAGEE